MSTERTDLTADQLELLQLLIQEESESAVASTDASLPESIIELAPGSGGAPLFCVGAFHFRKLASVLQLNTPIYGLLGQNLDADYSYMNRVEEMAARYVADIRAVYPTGPYRLAGFCFGGLVAYDMVKQFQDLGETVEHLILLDTMNPQTERLFYDPEATESVMEKMERHRKTLAEEGIRHLSTWVKDRFRYTIGQTAHASRKAIARAYKIAGQDIPIEYRGALTLDGNAAATWEYEPAPLDVPTLLVRSKALMEREGVDTINTPTNGWGDIITPRLTVHDTPVDHSHMLDDEHAPQVAAWIRAFIGG
jgi:thioesterase domain-containing protein